MTKLRKVRHTLSKTSARVPLVWMRHRGFRPTDVFVGSYPRSGSTWLRFMLLEILAGQSSSFNNTNEMLPDVGKHEAGASVLPGDGRLIKTHERYRPEYKRAIYLVRDPRDVALSEFAYQTALGLERGDFDRYLERFLQGGVNPFGSWIEHANSWMNAADSPCNDILHVNFEELKQKPLEQLSRIVDFLHMPEMKSRIPGAIENNSLTRMKEKEKAHPQRASAQGRFIRSGSAGGWRASFTERQCQLVQQYAGPSMARLGYSEVQSLEGQPA